jgi:hypothetical protein
VGHVAGIREQRKHIGNWIGEYEGNMPFRKPVYDRIILKCMLKIRLEGLKCICGAWEYWVVCYYEHGDELWSSIKFRTFLDYLIEHYSPKDCIVNGIIVTVSICNCFVTVCCWYTHMV